jgi:hypothetical protein
VNTSDQIQLWQTIGTWVLGALGAWFVFRQNKILERQNKLMSNQFEFNQFMMKREADKASDEDTTNTLLRVALGSLPREEEDDRELERLRAKGLSWQELRKRVFDIFTPLGQAQLTAALERMDKAQKRDLMRRAARTMYDQPAEIEAK